MKIRNRIQRLKKGMGTLGVLAVIGVSLFWNHTTSVYGYTYSVTGASPAGTVTVEPVIGKESNGYYTVDGYKVTYTITQNDWEAFDDAAGYGGFFYKGNQLEVNKGCGFAYAPDGNLWQAGALQLGALKDGVLVEKKNVVNNTVSCSFQIKSLSELPAYIAYCYHPASGAYRHITEEYGNTYHVWHYQKLAGTGVSNIAQIDMDAPIITCDIENVGKAVERDGIIWAKGANINVSAADAKSGVAGINLYQSGKPIQKLVNTTGAKTMTATYSVTENGNYQIDGTDRLNNVSAKKSITLSNIDNEIPHIEDLFASEEKFCLSNKITVVADDAGVGLEEKAYSWNGKEWTEEHTYMAMENGIYTVKVRDALGNEIYDSIEISNIDNKPPVIEKAEEVKNQSGIVQIVIEANDNEGGSGLHELPYSFDGGKTWKKDAYKEVNGNGNYEIVVRDAVELKASKVVVITSFKDDGDEVEDKKDEEIVEEPKPIPVIKTDDVMVILPDNTDDESKVKIENSEKKLSDSSTIFRPLTRRNKLQTTVVEKEEILSEAEEAVVESIIKPQPIAKETAPKMVVGVLLVVFALGLVGLILYLILFYLHYSCVLYGINDKQEKQRICRLLLHRFDTEWKVEIGDDKLGEHGTGRYVLRFHPSFVKEEMPSAVIIIIDGGSIREILDEEITFRI